MRLSGVIRLEWKTGILTWGKPGHLSWERLHSSWWLSRSCGSWRELVRSCWRGLHHEGSSSRQLHILQWLSPAVLEQRCNQFINSVGCDTAWQYMQSCLADKRFLDQICDNIMDNNANPVYGVATICHQVRCLRWGHPSLFHTATSLLIWYKMFSMRDILYRLMWMKFINMLSVYVQSGTHRRFNWWIIAVLT